MIFHGYVSLPEANSYYETFHLGIRDNLIEPGPSCVDIWSHAVVSFGHLLLSSQLHNCTNQIGTKNVVHFWSPSLGQKQFNVGKTMPFAPSPSHHHQTQERGWHRSHPPSIMEGSHCQTQSVTQWPCPPIGKIFIHNFRKKLFWLACQKMAKEGMNGFLSTLVKKMALLENGVYTWYIQCIYPDMALEIWGKQRLFSTIFQSSVFGCRLLKVLRCLSCWFKGWLLTRRSSSWFVN